MQIEVHALASGSSGNAVLIKAGDQGLLIDAGISARRMLPLLSQRGIRAGSLAGILLTHEHDDHVRGVSDASIRLRAPVVSNHRTLAAAEQRRALGAVEPLETGGELTIGPYEIRSFPVQHDAVDPVGYVVRVGGATIAYATDVGCVTPELLVAVKAASLIVLESNHDVEWLRRGPYPAFMKARVASATGHLSNHDAAECISERLEAVGPAVVWLAHLSAVNNSPALARRYVESAVKARTRVPFTLDVALRDRPSVQWRPGQAVFQPSLF